MKKTVAGILSVVLLLGLMAVPAQAATPEQIEASIEAGIAWLVSVQNDDGSWGPLGSDQIGTTGLIVVKLEDRAFELGFNGPFDPEYPYKGSVVAGLNFLLSDAYSVGISAQIAGDPDTDGDGVGVCSGGRIYNTSIAMMAIAAGRDPAQVVAAGLLAGWTYGAVLQDAADWMAYAQADTGDGRGGWFYTAVNGGSDADQSNSGYAMLGLLYAQAPLYNYESVIPSFVATELNYWIDYIQNDVGVDDPQFDGGSAYYAGYPPDYWVNSLKTGNLLTQMVFYGDDPSVQRVKDALDYIGRHWNDDWIQGWGKGMDVTQYQATYCLMKGFETMGIPLDGVPGVADWYQDMADEIVAEQDLDGSWPSSPAYVRPEGGVTHWVSPELSTAWALLTLERFAPPPVNEPPDCSTAVPSIALIWPPNHKFVQIEILGVTDPDGDPVTITIDSIWQDEPLDTNGDGSTCFDGQGVGTSVAEVRAERSGTPKVPGDGRVYHIRFTADDGKGFDNSTCSGEVLVGVPHDQGQRAVPVDGGALYDSTVSP